MAKCCKRKAVLEDDTEFFGYKVVQDKYGLILLGIHLPLRKHKYLNSKTAHRSCDGVVSRSVDFLGEFPTLILI